MAGTASTVRSVASPIDGATREDLSEPWRWMRCESCDNGGRAHLCATCRRTASEGYAGPRICSECAHRLSDLRKAAAGHPQQHSNQLGFCIDAHILDAVEAANRAGLTTVSSCQGSQGFFLGMPHIGFESLADAVALMEMVTAGADAYDEIWDRVRGNPTFGALEQWHLEVLLSGMIGEPAVPVFFVTIPARDLHLISERLGAQGCADGDTTNFAVR